MSSVFVDNHVWIPLEDFFKAQPGFVYLLGSSLVFYDGYRRTVKNDRSNGIAWQLIGIVLLLIGLWASIYYKSVLSFFIVVFGLAAEISLMRRWVSASKAPTPPSSP